jgi:hypothetical protein
LKKQEEDRKRKKQRARKKGKTLTLFFLDLFHQQNPEPHFFLQVEEISAAESHKKAAQTKADPLEEFCKDSPDAVSLRWFRLSVFFVLFLTRSFSLFSLSFSSFSRTRPSTSLLLESIKNRTSAASTRTRSFLFLFRERERGNVEMLEPS